MMSHSSVMFRPKSSFLEWREMFCSPVREHVADSKLNFSLKRDWPPVQMRSPAGGQRSPDGQRARRPVGMRSPGGQRARRPPLQRTRSGISWDEFYAVSQSFRDGRQKYFRVRRIIIFQSFTKGSLTIFQSFRQGIQRSLSVIRKILPFS